MPHLSGGWQQKYSTKRRQACHANERSIYSPMSMIQSQLHFWGNGQALLIQQVWTLPDGIGSALKSIYIGKVGLLKTHETTTVTLLTLAHLGDATQIR